MNELVEIAQHHWDNTEQKESKLNEMLMYAQVSHYIGNGNNGRRGGRQRFKGRRDHQHEPGNESRHEDHSSRTGVLGTASIVVKQIIG